MAELSQVSVDTRSWGRVIRIRHNDPNINEAVRVGFDRLVVERSTDDGSTWTELTTPSDRPRLEEGKVSYEYVDRNGDPDYLYRIKYYDAEEDDESDPSDSIEGSGLALLGVLSVDELKQRYLFGIDLTDDDGNPLPDRVFRFYILSAISWLEHQLDIPILPTTFTGEKHDYYREDYESFTILQLDNYPVIQVTDFTVQYPSGQNVVKFPAEWLRVDKNHGILRVVPTAGTLSEILIGSGGSYLPAIYNGMHHLPDLFSVDYEAGFEKVPSDLLDLIGMMASLGPFNIFGDLIVGAGIASLSVSIDGLSENIGTTSSATNAGYGARIKQYLEQIKKQVPNLRRFYKGIRLTSI